MFNGVNLKGQKIRLNPSYDSLCGQKRTENRIFFFQMATAYAGELFNINTYNQPGVEQGKIYTKAILNNPNFVKEKQEIENFFKN